MNSSSGSHCVSTQKHTSTRLWLNMPFRPFQPIHITLAWDKTNDVKQTIFVNMRASTYPCRLLASSTQPHMDGIYILNKFLSICLIQQKISEPPPPPPPVVIHESHMCRQAQLFFWMFIWHIPHTRRCSRKGAVTAKYLPKIPTIYAHFTHHTKRLHAFCHSNGFFPLSLEIRMWQLLG